GNQLTDSSAGSADPTPTQSVVRPWQERADTPISQRHAGFSGAGGGREQQPSLSASSEQSDKQVASGVCASSEQWEQLAGGSSAGLGEPCDSALPPQQQQQWLHWSSVEQPQGRPASG